MGSILQSCPVVQLHHPPLPKQSQTISTDLLPKVYSHLIYCPHHRTSPQLTDEIHLSKAIFCSFARLPNPPLNMPSDVIALQPRGITLNEEDVE